MKIFLSRYRILKMQCGIPLYEAISSLTHLGFPKASSTDPARSRWSMSICQIFHSWKKKKQTTPYAKRSELEHWGYEKVNYMEGFPPQNKAWVFGGSRVVPVDLLGEEESKEMLKGPQMELNIRTQLSGALLDAQVVSQLVFYEFCPFFSWHFWLWSGFVPSAFVCFLYGQRHCESSLAVICGWLLVCAAWSMAQSRCGQL